MEIIISSQALLSRIWLTIDLHKNKYKEVSSLSGHYKNAKILVLNEETKIANKVLKTMHMNAKTLNKIALRGKLRGYGIFNSILKDGLINLTHLSITDFPGEDDNEIFEKSPFFNAVNLPNLKHLEVYNCLKFLPLLKTHQITTLKAFEERRYLPMLYMEASNYQNEVQRLAKGVVAFLKSCNLLTHLHLDSIKYRDIFIEKNYPFKLKKGTFASDGLDEGILIIFLKTQKDSLKSLAANVSTPTSKIVNFATNDLQLTHLDVDLFDFPVIEFDKIDIKNSSIKSLDIPEFPSKRLGLCSLAPRMPRKIMTAPGEKLLDACINVEALGMYDFHKDIIKSICKLKKLKIMRMHYAPDELPEEDFTLNTVEHLEMDLVMLPVHAQNVINFLPHLPKLKFLKINIFEACTEQVFLDLATVLPALVVELHLGTNIVFSGQMMHKLNDLRKQGHALERISFLENGSRAKEFASFKVDKFFFKAYEKESGYFDNNRLTICDSRNMTGSFIKFKAEFEAVVRPKK